MIKSNSRFEIRFIVEAGIMIALATILSYIKIYTMPNGGSLTAGSMVPILIIGLRYGVKKGIFVGVVYGILQSILQPFVVHPIQYLLDYPLAFGFLGLSGIAKETYRGHINEVDNEYISIVLAMVVAILGRMSAHLMAGAVFFKEFAGDQNPWIYSAIYNGSFLIPELIVSTVIVVVLWKPIKNMGNDI